MKHLSHRTIAIIVALLSTLSLALAVISLPHQAYAVDGTDGTSGTEILTSDWLEERALASTYSYRKFTVTGWAPLFAEASACIGTLCVMA